MLHRRQKESRRGIWNKAFNLVLVGRTFQAIFQRNKRSPALRFSFQRDFQWLETKGEEVEVILGMLINL